MLIHLHQRKRLSKKIKNVLSFPHPDPKIRFLDNLVMFVSIIYPFTAIPQIYEIWVEKKTAGVSFLTWFLWFVLNFVLLIYGIVHKEKSLTIMWTLWTVVHIIVLTGLVIHG